MFRLKEPDKEEYIVCVSENRFEIFVLFFADAGYKIITGEPLKNFKNHYGYFHVYKADKTISFSETNLGREEDYGLMELIEKVGG